MNKKIKIIGFGVIAIMMSFNLLNNATNQSGDIKLQDMLKLPRALAAELPEVIITCGSTTGPCWDGDCETQWTPLGPTRMMDCPTFTGSMNDNCLDEAPCW